MSRKYPLEQPKPKPKWEGGEIERVRIHCGDHGRGICAFSRHGREQWEPTQNKGRVGKYLHEDGSATWMIPCTYGHAVSLRDVKLQPILSALADAGVDTITLTGLQRAAQLSA